MAKSKKVLSSISECSTDSKQEASRNDDIDIKKRPLYGKKVAISVSSSEDIEYLGLSEHHLNDISIEIARYLIVNGATLLYGGDLRLGGFTRLFSELSFQYKFLGERQCRFINYFPFPNSRGITLDDESNFVKQQVGIIKLAIPKHLGSVDIVKEYRQFESIEDRFILSECYSDMRTKMAHESDARILIGGKQKVYSGFIPGIIEEAYHTLVKNKPIYLIGGFGGATKSLINIIQKKNSKELTNKYQYDSNFYKKFRKYCKDRSSINIDYNHLVEFFQQYSIESISKENGLSSDENLTLFESTNIHELVFLIVKGLKNIYCTK